ncbi:hypothetical protein [Xylanibacillus composti]|uniref:hypothetical protein n=1 Tax=Xylanibacillus composti TaxID=1572762 RepID=UPI001BCB157C|nr:hypothetical protein [Xylanibacillus composti]
MSRVPEQSPLAWYPNVQGTRLEEPFSCREAWLIDPDGYAASAQLRHSHRLCSSRLRSRVHA